MPFALRRSQLRINYEKNTLDFVFIGETLVHIDIMTIVIPRERLHFLELISSVTNARQSVYFSKTKVFNFLRHIKQDRMNASANELRTASSPGTLIERRSDFFNFYV